jgi:hypothetical protein
MVELYTNYIRIQKLNCSILLVDLYLNFIRIYFRIMSEWQPFGTQTEIFSNEKSDCFKL